MLEPPSESGLLRTETAQVDEPLQDGVELGIRADTDQAEGNGEGQGGAREDTE